MSDQYGFQKPNSVPEAEEAQSSDAAHAVDRPAFVPPPSPNYVDHEGKRREPTEYEVVGHKRKVIFALAEHLGWGEYKGDRLPRASTGNLLRVTMQFERGQRDYFVDAEDSSDPLTRRQNPDAFGSAV